MQVRGTFGKSGGAMAITSLTFITNEATFGPFGSPRGQQFQSCHGKVMGFFGKASAGIDQLGLITKLRAGSPADVVSQTTSQLGPWGGEGGQAFHDGQGHIREINVYHSSSHIVSLQVAYAQGDTVLYSARHGDSSEGNLVKVLYISLIATNQHASSPLLRILIALLLTFQSMLID